MEPSTRLAEPAIVVAFHGCRHMSPDLNTGESSARPVPQGVDDHFLITSALGGDSVALRSLMDRYDRLVRYTVFRGAQRKAMADPQWVDSVASATWTGLIQSMRRQPDNPPDSISNYLVRIARNCTVSALRREPKKEMPLQEDDGGGFLEPAAEGEDPSVLLERVELLGTLRECLSELGGEMQRASSQLDAIMGRRWQEAAAALGVSESTLRSRWKKTLELLRGCLERKSGESIAP